MAREKFYEVPRILPNGVAVFPKKGLTPPPSMEGYQRKSPNLKSSDAWVFIPLWSDCPFRAQKFVQRESGCRCVKIVMSCNHNPNQPLTLQACQNCTLRESHEQQSLIKTSSGDGISQGVMVSSERNPESITESPQPETRKGDLLAPENSPVIETQG